MFFSKIFANSESLMLLLFSDLVSPALILLPCYLKLRQQFDLGIHLLPAHRGHVNGITILLLKYKVKDIIFYRNSEKRTSQARSTALSCSSELQQNNIHGRQKGLPDKDQPVGLSLFSQF